MLCCVGLFGGYAVGQYLGGPWTVIAPAAGFGIGLVADMKLMKGHHKKGDQHDTGSRAKKDTDPVRGTEVYESKAEHQLEKTQRRDEPRGSTIMEGRKTA
jgi:hypothetical protein